MIEWKDSTSYSRDRERVQNAWEATIGPLRLGICRAHIYYPGKWTWTAFPFTREASALPGNIATDDVAGAQAAAIHAARTILKPYVNAFRILSDGDEP